VLAHAAPHVRYWSQPVVTVHLQHVRGVDPSMLACPRLPEPMVGRARPRVAQDPHLGPPGVAAVSGR
jgi:hypothetical protein